MHARAEGGGGGEELLHIKQPLPPFNPRWVTLFQRSPEVLQP